MATLISSMTVVSLAHRHEAAPIGEAFARAIEQQRDRGFRLHSWRLTDSGEWLTIVAVFERAP